jgi:chromosome segregation ATPase
MWKNTALGKGHRTGNKNYVKSETESSVSPDTKPQPRSLSLRQQKQDLRQLLRSRHGKETEQRSNSKTEAELWKKELQSRTQDELCLLRKYCGDLQKENLSLTKESNDLRAEREELKSNFDGLKSKYSDLINNLNTVTEERDALEKGTDKLMRKEGSVKVTSEELVIAQEDHLMLTQERDTLRSEHEKLKVNFGKLERKCSTLKECLNSVTEDSDALQKYTDKLVHMRNGMKTILNELLGTQKALLAITQEHEELEINFEKLKKECSTLKDNLNVIRGKCDALQKSKNLLQDTEARVNMVLDKEPSIQNPHLITTQEEDTLRSQYEELKVSFFELIQEYCILKEDLNVIREERDTLQKGKR